MRRIRMIVSLDDGTSEEVTVKGEQAWLDQSNAWLKARRYDGRVCGVDAYAGKRLIGSWHAVESDLTPEEREEGRTAFMDDLTIKGVVG